MVIKPPKYDTCTKKTLSSIFLQKMAQATFEKHCSMTKTCSQCACAQARQPKPNRLLESDLPWMRALVSVVLSFS